jgi:ergothioneine biosynthesis protein EgtB
MMQRSDLMRDYSAVRKTTQKICEPLKTEDYIVQPIPDVSPPKWHLAHTTWFFEAMLLKRFWEGYEPHKSLYSYLFNSYYQSLGPRWERQNRGTLSRPTVEEVYTYRSVIDQKITGLIERVPETDWDDFAKLMVLGLNHEQQHQELLVMDIKCILALNPLYPPYFADGLTPGTVSPPAEQQFLRFRGGVYEIGAPDGRFSYDNEGPVHCVSINDFLLSDRLVSNAEYLEFVEAGGYENYQWWLADGWDFIQQNQIESPLFWREIDGVWHEATLRGLGHLVPEDPVCHVSYYEADAFANWSGKRLPTEQEWEVAAAAAGVDPAQGNFLDDSLWHPRPDTGGGNNGGQPRQMLGDLWEWTASAYLPYPGYRRQAGPLGEYNGKFMNNQMVLRGGSCATPRDHIRISYRNFFQSEKRWQFSGIRLADDPR